MLKPKHFFAVILFFLFMYVFGYHSFCKYLRRSTIVIRTTESSQDIPAPAITVVPEWKDFENPFEDPYSPCWLDDNVYECLEENYTVAINDMIVNSTDYKWTKRFEPLHSLLFTLDPSSLKLSTNVSEAIFIEIKNDTWPLIPFGDMMGSTIPWIKLHDPKYFTYTTNPR